MDLYRATFAGSLLLNAFAFYQSHRSRKAAVVEAVTTDKKEEHSHVEPDLEGLSKLKKRFFPIYLLVNAADWLQGPYIYPIYKDEKGLPEELVAFLFLTGFIAAGVSASFAGGLADRYGRKAACLGYCVIYSLSCATLLTNNIYVLFLGRILGGVCGTILWSVFESWLVAEFNQLMIQDGEAHLSAIFSTMTTSNTCVAIAAGIFAEWAVRCTGTAKAPFMAAIVCLALSFVAISRCWGENYGSSSRRASETEGLLQQEEATPAPAPTSALRTILRDRNILILALVSGFFEGSLFLFIFFKFPALKLSHKLAGSTEEELPFGLIFAILMCSMMLGSLLYKHVSTSSSPMPAQKMLTGILAVSSACFFIPGHFRDERVTLWCFCIFELCCGIYYPAMGSLKSKLIEDGSRASIYGILRIPLNVFVVLALSTTKEGEAHRDTVFTTCSVLLVVAAIFVHKTLA
ncbi:major facilitator superfamily domain containing protein 5 [Pyrenophora tritici-repentis Pt-1C-BFP]|uniref:Molybdate-anion transporter n=1 Tax=Pyrenophora tritici-repentis (strain Pt-1C-BFP) TaxID=426418 RepID=B2W8V3_PYRTR|nr:major facilitator superfamily domain containing protein 5 [Pyrenophora tritici-repentis Pt-1C-BFP]EDU49331.1 major facilitator superfamily domain containing protein 5 [Pyrenophora tritici-repentis Pt-1C-BFP]